MKLLKLLNRFSNSFLKIGYSLIILTFFIHSCEDKIPTKSVDENILHFSEATLQGDQLTVVKEHSKYATGNDSYLFIGETSDFQSVALIKFPDFETLPDSVAGEAVFQLGLTLYPSENLPVDTNDTDANYINIFLVKSPLDWDEDETTFNVDNPLDEALEKEFITRFFIGEEDTCTIDLLEHKDKFIPFWYDSTNASSGLLIEGDPENGNHIQRLYSHNNSGKEPTLKIQWAIEDDTTSKTYTPDDDLSIFFNKNSGEDRSQFLSVSEAYNEILRIDFSINDLMEVTDSNIYVPEARLKLHVDLENSVYFNENIYLYLALLDTNEYYDEYLYDITSSDNGVVLTPNDSVAVFTLSSDIQNYFRGTQDNLGMVIWSAYKTNDMAQIRFFGQEAEDTLKPKLQVLFAKEERK
ncbi:MAG: hypothetical protein JXQ65_11950 [Candidatus Marinimicrobia bacterium]|nr:hypothetical protein [Candidatus Neomarinimicrobiota bacterium]